MTDMLTNHARALALRGKLIGVGFDPLTVAYDDVRDLYIVQPMLPFDHDVLESWFDANGYRIFETYRTSVGVTYSLARKDAQL